MTQNRIADGFGLVEVLVALAIGMIATVIMLQTLAVSESQKRTTTGAADAQNNGAISLFSMERDIKMAGWGLHGSEFAGCTEFFTYQAGGAIDSNTTPGSSLVSALEITDGGTGPDTVTIRHYDDPSNQDFRPAITRISTTQTTPADPFTLRSTMGCRNIGDLIVVTNGTDCTLAQISAVNTTTNKVSHESGGTFPYNPPADQMTTWPKYDGTASVQCVPRLYTRTYSLDTSSFKLQLTDDAGTPINVSPNIMDVQAEYGIDNGAGGTDWVAATGSWGNPNIAGIRQIKAARIAVLARSETFEKPQGGGSCDTTTSVAGMSSWATFNTTSFPSDWECYRYKAYEINVPLRNVIWSR